MFAEFELRIHETVEAGRHAVGRSVHAAVWRAAAGATTATTKACSWWTIAYNVEWAYIPHFYYNFYVYQYATSIAASSLLVERVRRGEPGAAESYLELLASGGSQYPYDQLVEAGVDLATPEPYEALMRRMSAIMDEIEEIVTDA